MPEASPPINRQPAAAQKLGKNQDFILVPEEEVNACRYCMGERRIAVTTRDGTVGYLIAEFGWWLELPADPAQHPQHPHYEVQWSAVDPEGAAIPLPEDLITLTDLAGVVIAHASPTD